MKTILFFDRCDLTRMYSLVTNELQGMANIIHVAYSPQEAKTLEEFGINDYIDYQKELAHQFDTLQPNDALIKEIDELIIDQSNGLFTLNGSIQSDRGYTVLNYQESLLLACCHYTVWKNIFAMQHVDVMYHEPASQFMTHIAGLLCKRQGGDFLYPTQLLSDHPGYTYLNLDGENFTSKDTNKNYDYYLKHPEEVDIDRCKVFLEKYRKDYSVAFSGLIKPKKTKMGLCNQAIRTWLIKLYCKGKYDRIRNNIDYWMLNTNPAANKIHNLREYKKRRIQFSQPVDGEKYFYYSIHLEPEATVLYLGGGKYVNQVKLIENIAASLPAGYYLYVKDHPHEFAYRKADDYERLLKVPNIRLIDQRIAGKNLIQKAVGVFSIVGTAGFEALMLGKQSYCFGETYYTTTPRVNYVRNINDLQKIVYENMSRDYSDDMELYAFIYSYLKSLREGFVTYFGKDRVINSGINECENAKILAQNIIGKKDDK